MLLFVMWIQNAAMTETNFISLRSYSYCIAKSANPAGIYLKVLSTVVQQMHNYDNGA